MGLLEDVYNPTTREEDGKVDLFFICGVGMAGWFVCRMSEALDFGCVQQRYYSIVLHPTCIFLANAYHDKFRVFPSMYRIYPEQLVSCSVSPNLIIGSSHGDNPRL